MEQITEQEIINGLKHNSIDVFTYLFNRFNAKLNCYAFKIIQNDIAYDIVTDTFHKLWLHNKNFNSLASIQTWMYTVTRNSCLDYLRNQKKRSLFEKQYKLTVDTNASVNIEHAMIEAEVLQKIYAGINSLPEKCRRIFMLWYFEDLSTIKISEQLHVSKSTVKYHIKKAIDAIRIYLKNNKMILVCKVVTGMLVV